MAVDRAIRLSETLLDKSREDWSTLRDAIRDEVLANGYDPSKGAFTLAYELREFDAACLHVGLSGLLPPTDERLTGTVAAVEQNLRDGAGLRRYRFDDGLAGNVVERRGFELAEREE